MKEYIFVFNQNKVIKIIKNKRIVLNWKMFKKIVINDIIYYCKIKNQQHKFNSDSNYNYCWNCAYMTWDIGKSVGKYCVPLIIGKFQVIRKIKKWWLAIIEIKSLTIYQETKLLLDFKFKRINNKQYEIINSH